MRAITIVALLLVAPAVLAQGGFYVGIGLGSLDYDDRNPTRVVETFILNAGRISDSAPSYKLYGGFELNEHFAIEFSYGTTGALSGEGLGADPPPLPNDFIYTMETELQAVVAKAVGRYPIGERMALFGSVGYLYIDGETRFAYQVPSRNPVSYTASFDDNYVLVTGGIEWRLGEEADSRLGIRLEYEWWDRGPADAATLGVGLTYRF